jgi:hypothetical protein
MIESAIKTKRQTALIITNEKYIFMFVRKRVTMVSIACIPELNYNAMPIKNENVSPTFVSTINSNYSSLIV